jgi:U4/U6.U5 tri-snRNP component SNU23
MSKNLNYKQVANVTRRTWDVETYEQRAKERTENADDSGKKPKSSKKGGPAPPSVGDKRPLTMEEEDEANKEEFIPAVAGAAGPHKSKRAFLKSRRNKVDVDSKIGSVEIVNPEAAATTKANVGEGSIKVS